MAALRLTANAFVRAAPHADAAPLGFVRKNAALAFGGKSTPDGWHAVDWRGETGWVSGKMAAVEE